MVAPYTVELHPEAQDSLRRLSKLQAQRILTKIRWLAENFAQISHETLTGEFRGLFKLRVGDYRVIYSVDHREQRIVIHLIGHRRNIYEHH